IAVQQQPRRGDNVEGTRRASRRGRRGRKTLQRVTHEAGVSTPGPMQPRLWLVCRLHAAARNSPSRNERPEARPKARASVYRATATLLKIPLRLVPMDPMTVTTTIAISPAISAYSIAVTPDSSLNSLTGGERNKVLLGVRTMSSSATLDYAASAIER